MWSSLRFTVDVAKDKIEYYADLLYNCMQGAGTDDKTLIRMVLSRSELDLGDIKAKYLEKYGKTLDHSIEVSWRSRRRVHCGDEGRSRESLLQW